MHRVAYFPDSFHEVNGVAHTSRHFQAYAGRTGLPFLCVRAALEGGAATGVRQASHENLMTLDLPHSRARIRLERDLFFDPLFARHRGVVLRALRAFQPTVLHITGPSDVGLLGAWAARKLRIPLAMGWHTNVHEYAGARAATLLGVLPANGRKQLAAAAERGSLWATQQFYRLGQVLFAPNPELVDMLRRATARPCFLMERGLDTAMFSPEKRSRPHDDGRLVLGYVGRLSAEKNVYALAELQRQLESRGVKVEFLIVGHGLAEAELRTALRGACFAGVLTADPLARAYADMDLFVFPSETDTFGNVVLEALASGVPALVTDRGGPKFLVRDGVDGFVSSVPGFADAVVRFAGMTGEQRQKMREDARGSAQRRSWNAVFDGVVRSYP